MYTREQEWEICRSVYEPLIPYLKKHHVMALLENMFSRGVEGERYAAACSDFQEAALWVKDVSEAESILTKVLPQLRAERPYEQLTFDW